jgi:hypothetical protein
MVSEWSIVHAPWPGTTATSLLLYPETFFLFSPEGFIPSLSRVYPEYKLSLYRLGTNSGKAWNKQENRTGQSSSRLQAEGRKEGKMLKRVQHGRERELQAGKGSYASEHRSLQDDKQREGLWVGRGFYEEKKKPATCGRLCTL